MLRRLKLTVHKLNFIKRARKSVNIVKTPAKVSVQPDVSSIEPDVPAKIIETKVDDSVEVEKPVAIPPPPISILPTEILLMIFRHCLDRYLQLRRPDGGPWRLGQVCRQWRTIVLTAHGLWSRFDAVPDAKAPFRWENRILNLIESCVERSGDTLISFRLYIGNHTQSQFLAKHSHLWEKVLINLEDEDETEGALSERSLFFSRIRGKLPNLRTLLVYNDIPLDEQFQQTIASAPNLCHLTFIRAKCFTTFTIPSLRITLLRLLNTTLGPGVLLSMLSCMAPSLEQLYLNNRSKGNIKADTHPVPVTFPHLRVLSLQYGGQSEYQLILDCLTAPALIDFEIQMYPISLFRQPSDSLFAFLERSACTGLQNFFANGLSTKNVQRLSVDLKDVGCLKLQYNIEEVMHAVKSKRSAEESPITAAKVEVVDLGAINFDYFLGALEGLEVRYDSVKRSCDEGNSCRVYCDNGCSFVITA